MVAQSTKLKPQQSQSATGDLRHSWKPMTFRSHQRAKETLMSVKNSGGSCRSGTDALTSKDEGRQAKSNITRWDLPTPGLIMLCGSTPPSPALPLPDLIKLSIKMKCHRGLSARVRRGDEQAERRTLFTDWQNPCAEKMTVVNIHGGWMAASKPQDLPTHQESELWGWPCEGS